LVEGEKVYLFIYANADDGYIFDKWTSVPASFAASGVLVAENMYRFEMPARDVALTAHFVPSTVDGVAKVRFAWEAAEQDKIVMIAADSADFADWYFNVYMLEDYVEEDATDIPLYKGSAQLPGNLYSSTLGTTEHKGTYYEIDPDQYTAVCSGEDEYGIFDIVANYTIELHEDYEATATEDGKDNHFTVNFDIATFLDEEFGSNETAWFFQNDLEDGTKAPFLQKRKGGRFAKRFEFKSASVDVTFYVLRRAKK
jgi:hypothetical protein